MDKKKKIIAILGLLIGIGFLYLGFQGMKAEQTPMVDVQIDEPADTNSADALGNIK